jgi:hypothetical protein
MPLRTCIPPDSTFPYHAQLQQQLGLVLENHYHSQQHQRVAFARRMILNT